ncbi:aryl-sulfate sulfotransferase [Mucilaginibacter sabulilitoris]|uniref:Aryl-sulfate sulfotransferase n=1 Tax=Mucilaginibacter sabulilitoris TaxID=1173583 RepID=A0ABZ0TTI6_9SPHI|nr:aryl-sulfate sulfotransferase [Mucilaginibacter sabulilitoris]WPU96081.1 aryl-sulfate sulfotransferase [Mucilaginibacter sabulilitoris]
MVQNPHSVVNRKMRCFLICLAVLVFTVVFASCNNSNAIKEIKVGLHNNNELKIQVDVLTASPADVYAEYWEDEGADTTKQVSPVSKNTDRHRLVLCNIAPKTNYAYHIITVTNGVKNISKTYTFSSYDLPMFLQDQFTAKSASEKHIPAEFKDGLMLINKRYAPGVAYLVDYKGRIRWYHMIDDLGFKVINFTKDHTLLSILGRNDEPTSYGSEILEINLLGDTLLHLKKGQRDFKQTIHHEILKNKEGNLVTLFVDQKIMDLTAIGGSKQDTVNGDGIMIMDNTGKQLYKWSVFDVMDPLKDRNLLKTKKDWMHANSLNYDRDGNYLMSFYNNGQIWKIDAHTGKVIYKFGKGGTITMPAECNFTQAHAAHINANGNLMFFDNGVEKHQSGVFAMKLDEQRKASKIDLHIQLPKEVFNGRMGSAYMINDTSVLVCCSKRHIIVLTDRKGVLLWTMETSVPTYRAGFITSKELSPYLKP